MRRVTMTPTSLSWRTFSNTMVTKKIFLASSSELKEDRKQFEIFIGRKNKDWVARGVFLELVVWEDFLDAVSQTRLQDEYNQAIRECDLFVMLFCTKVGQYTEEEFATAFGQFKATNKPFIFTYFKDAQISTGSANQEGPDEPLGISGEAECLGHFYTVYKNIDELKFHFSQQLDKLAASGFIEFKPDKGEAASPGGTTYRAELSGSGAIAQGPARSRSAPAASWSGTRYRPHQHWHADEHRYRRRAYIGRRVDTGGGDFVGRDKITHGVSARKLEPLFAPCWARSRSARRLRSRPQPYDTSTSSRPRSPRANRPMTASWARSWMA